MVPEKERRGGEEGGERKSLYVPAVHIQLQDTNHIKGT